MPQYKRPPITEAVIGVHFDPKIPREEIDKFRARFEAEYPLSEPFTTVGIEVDVIERQTKFDEQTVGHKLTSLDKADVLLVTTAHLTFSRLAPYNGWDAFRTRAADNWRTWKRLAGYRKIKNVGVRYINRIDIPAVPDQRVKIEDYLKVYPEAPEAGVMSAMAGYTMQLVGPLGEDNCRLVINSSLVPSPLVNHISIVFDIDVVRQEDVPQNDEELWALIERIRGHKNRVFESSVTDRARELFDR